MRIQGFFMMVHQVLWALPEPIQHGARRRLEGNLNLIDPQNVMKTLKQVVAVATAAMALGLGGNLAAQDQPAPRPERGGGNFDPAQMRQRMMERYREQFDVKDDAEWKIIEERIEKVTTARMASAGGFGGMFGRGRGGGPGGGGGGGGAMRFGAEPMPEAEALQKAIDAKASGDEIKTKLAKYREALKAKQADLEKAQDELRKVLTVRQEAVAVLNGMLK